MLRKARVIATFTFLVLTFVSRAAADSASLEFDVSYNIELENLSDTRLYSFSLPNDSVATLSLSAESGFSRWIIAELSSSSQTDSSPLRSLELRGTNSETGISSSSALGLRALQPNSEVELEDYTLLIRNGPLVEDSYTPENFELRVSLSEPDYAFETAPNQSRENAQALPSSFLLPQDGTDQGTPVKGYWEKEYPRADYYSFTLPSNGVVEIDLQLELPDYIDPEDLIIDASLVAFDSLGEIRSETEFSLFRQSSNTHFEGFPAFESEAELEPLEYILQIKPRSYSALNELQFEYQFSLTHRPRNDYETENNNTLAQATRIKSSFLHKQENNHGTPIEGTLRDEDIFSFEMPADGNITLNFDAVDGQFDGQAFLTLYRTYQVEGVTYTQELKYLDLDYSTGSETDIGLPLLASDNESTELYYVSLQNDPIVSPRAPVVHSEEPYLLTLTYNEPLEQSITGPLEQTLALGETMLELSSDSLLTLTFSSSNPSVLQGGSGSVNPQSLGYAQVLATQPGDRFYHLPAESKMIKVRVVYSHEDYDADGLPNVWESEYGLDPDDPSDANLDTDFDGTTNLNEFLSKTDPTDSNSKFSIESISLSQDETLTLRWPAQPGLRYRLQQSDTPDGDDWTDLVVTSLQPDTEAATLSAEVSPSQNKAAYFRIVAIPETVVP